jgi:peptidoglycan-associated lipoprotein
MRFHRLTVGSLAALCVVAVGACHKAAPAPAPAPVTPAPNADSIRMANQARADSIARAQAAAQARADSIARAQQAAEALAAAQSSMRATLATTIYFDYDKADLRDDARAALDAKLPILTANSDITVRISGHTDERGSDEYNMALGQRRAATAKQYLVDHGVDAGRIETVSYGEERPVAQGHDEGAWSQNRRAEFEITAAPATIKQP